MDTVPSGNGPRRSNSLKGGGKGAGGVALEGSVRGGRGVLLAAPPFDDIIVTCAQLSAPRVLPLQEVVELVPPGWVGAPYPRQLASHRN